MAVRKIYDLAEYRERKATAAQQAGRQSMSPAHGAEARARRPVPQERGGRVIRAATNVGRFLKSEIDIPDPLENLASSRKHIAQLMHSARRRGDHNPRNLGFETGHSGMRITLDDPYRRAPLLEFNHIDGTSERLQHLILLGQGTVAAISTQHSRPTEHNRHGDLTSACLSLLPVGVRTALGPEAVAAPLRFIPYYADGKISRVQRTVLEMPHIVIGNKLVKEAGIVADKEVLSQHLSIRFEDNAMVSIETTDPQAEAWVINGEDFETRQRDGLELRGQDILSGLRWELREDPAMWLTTHMDPVK
jgi:hypothetical protein